MIGFIPRIGTRGWWVVAWYLPSLFLCLILQQIASDSKGCCLLCPFILVSTPTHLLLSLDIFGEAFNNNKYLSYI
jgi:hypothetical protein